MHFLGRSKMVSSLGQIWPSEKRQKRKPQKVKKILKIWPSEVPPRWQKGSVIGPSRTRDSISHCRSVCLSIRPICHVCLSFRLSGCPSVRASVTLLKFLLKGYPNGGTSEGQIFQKNLTFWGFYFCLFTEGQIWPSEETIFDLSRKCPFGFLTFWGKVI